MENRELKVRAIIAKGDLPIQKTRRTFKNKEAIQNYLNGHKILHNFIHKNPTIKTTPAQASGIELGLNRNKWQSLLIKAITGESYRQVKTD